MAFPRVVGHASPYDPEDLRGESGIVEPRVGELAK